MLTEAGAAPSAIGEPVSAEAGVEESAGTGDEGAGEVSTAVGALLVAGSDGSPAVVLPDEPQAARPPMRIRPAAKRAAGRWSARVVMPP
jgi:hypothetical protein